MVKHKKRQNTSEAVESIKLDIACGNNKQDGFIGIDKVKTDKTDVVMDLEQYPWSFPDNYTDEVNISHYIEHIYDLMKFMNELYRIMKPQTTATIVSPYYTSTRAWQDPTHKRAISEASFLYFNKKWREDNKLQHYPITCDFDFTYGYIMYPDFISRAEEYRAFAMRHFWNVVSDLKVILTKRI